MRFVDCGSCRARSDGLCTGASAGVLRIIAGYKSGDRLVKAGQDLFSLGEPCDTIYNLVEGWMFLYSLEADGRRHILHFAFPGAVLGFFPAPNIMATHSVQALTDAVLCVISRDGFERLLRERPEMGLRLAGLMARDRCLSFDHLTSIGQHSARERVAHLLLELFVRYSSRWPGRQLPELHLPLTQEQIGDATGLTLVHVNRVLRDLRENGILEFHRRRLRILDPDKLTEIAGVDPRQVLSWAPSVPDGGSSRVGGNARDLRAIGVSAEQPPSATTVQRSPSDILAARAL